MIVVRVSLETSLGRGVSLSESGAGMIGSALG